MRLTCRRCGAFRDYPHNAKIEGLPAQQWFAGRDELCKGCHALPEPPAAIAHDGATYDPAVDAKPLNAQQQAVFQAMKDGAWHTLAELAGSTGCPEASVSARLRDLRKPKWGSHTVERRRRVHAGQESRTWEYCLVVQP